MALFDRKMQLKWAYDNYLTKISTLNKSLFSLLINKGRMWDWKKDDYKKLPGLKPKVRKPYVLKSLMSGYPGIFHSDITVRMSKHTKVIAQRKYDSMKKFFEEFLPSQSNQRYVGSYFIIKPILTISDYGVISVDVNPFNSRRVRNYPEGYKIMIQDIYNSFIESYKGNHKLSNFIIIGDYNQVYHILFRNI